MFGARPRSAGPPAGRMNRPISFADVQWRSRWPFILTAILGAIIVLFTFVIIALEIASLAKWTDSFTLFGKKYASTASTGAGIWCGMFALIAGILMLVINMVRRARLWSTIAFVASIIAACFMVILIGLDAKAVQDGRDLKDLIGIFDSKFKVLAAQLAFACIVFVLLIIFILIYLIVLCLKPKVPRPPIYGVPPRGRY